MQSLWTIIKNTGVYFVGTILTKVIALFMIPIYTRYILPKDYGFYDLAITYISVIISIIFLNLNIACLRFFLDKDEKLHKVKVASNIFVLFFCSAAVYSAAFLIIPFFKEIPYLGLIYLYGLFSSLVSIYLASARGYGKNKIFVAAGVMASIINALLSALLLYFGCDFSALFISMIAANIIEIIFLEFSLGILRNFSLASVDKNMLKSILYFSLPLVLNGCSYWLCSSYSKIVISSKLGMEANGLYAIAGKFGLVISLAGSCFSLAWQEMSYKKTTGSQQNTEFFSKAFSFYLKIVLSFYIVLVPFINLVFPYVVAEKYYPARYLVALYMLWVLLDMVTNFLGNIITGFKWTNAVFFTTLAGGLISVISLYAIVPKLGLNGASISLSLGFIVTWGLRWILLKKRIGIKTDFCVLCLFLPAVALVASNVLLGSVYMLLIMSVFALIMTFKELQKIYLTVKSKIMIGLIK